MPTNWLTVRVELLGGGRDDRLWPRPGRIMLVGPRHTFQALAEAVNDAFGRWDHAHLWEFTLGDGRRIALPDPDDDEPAEDASTLTVAEAVRHGAEFQYVFDLGDYWVHRCSVHNTRIDPMSERGPVPRRPVPVVGWGWLPDQHGRRWEDDDGESPEPAPPADDDPMITGTWPHESASTRRPRRTSIDLPALRGATVRRDRAAIQVLLTGHNPRTVLQHAGDALLTVGIEGMEDIARMVEQGLRDRDDEGDAELADVLAGRLGGPVPMLRAIPVGLDDVAELMNGDLQLGSGGWVDLETGQTWPDEVLDNLDEEDRPDVDAEPGRWWYVDREGSRASWRDRHDFAAGQPPGPFRERLLDALDGRGAFRRFARVLDDDPDVLTQWRAFGDERQRGRARALLAAHGYTPN